MRGSNLPSIQMMIGREGSNRTASTNGAWTQAVRGLFAAKRGKFDLGNMPPTQLTILIGTALVTCSCASAPAPRIAPSVASDSPLALFFNFSHNVVKGAAVDAMLWG